MHTDRPTATEPGCDPFADLPGLTEIGCDPSADLSTGTQPDCDPSVSVLDIKPRCEVSPVTGSGIGCKVFTRYSGRGRGSEAEGQSREHFSR
jgi:hypothetical protein